ncbi:hypothetical protein ALC60_13788 [Trachymyrmex zeteki]|uniref:Uncharacterized protein n=1 Tax=Mycetomoellerius zeteki TaxID=64791 RepID=A0A151WHB1_9HYME|nr:hypothetical protein ALC60_13788 [Trachymyrmex zeteki]
MSVDQVRWKINALTKKYKECIDNNRKLGRSLTTFEWFNELDEILGRAIKKCCCRTLCQNHSNENSEIISECTSILSITNKRKRPLHGSGSNLARTKVALENQWLTYLKTKDAQDKRNDGKYADSLE